MSGARAGGRWRGLAAGYGLAGLAAIVTMGCAGRAAQPEQRPAPLVTVVKAELRDMPIVVEAIGTTRALNEVTVRSRVAGFLEQGPPELFQEGSDVSKGQLLLVIDEAPFQAARDSAKATLDQNEAELAAAKDSKEVAIHQAQLLVSQARQFYAQVQERRAQQLYARNAITREEYDEKKADLMQADADVQAKRADLDQAGVTFSSNIALSEAKVAKAKADLTQAELDLSYCRMSSPIDGRAGELQVKLGNYVGKYAGTSGGESGSLLMVEQLDPMGIDFRPSSRFLPAITGLVKGGLTCKLFVQGERPFPHDGKLIFLDNTVDPTTSTFLLRASVPNPDKTLLPGDYVRTRTTIGTYEQVVVVPEPAVVETQSGPSVFVVDQSSVVTRVPIKRLDTHEGLVAVEAGLEPGQQVVVKGTPLIRSGQPVRVESIAFDAAVPRVESATPLPSRANKLDSPKARPIVPLPNEGPAGPQSQ